MTENANAPVPPPVPKKSKGCLIYGCLALLIVVVLICVGLFFTVRSAMKALNEFTDTKSVELPALVLNSTDQSALKERIAAFQKSLNQTGGGAVELQLTGDEINALLAGSKDAGPLAQRVRVRIEGDKLFSTLSVPLEEIGLSKQPGRYLNGEASLSVGLSQGVPSIVLQDLKVRGNSLPDAVMLQLRSANLAKDIQKNPDAAKWLEKLEKVEIKEGKLVLRSKP